MQKAVIQVILNVVVAIWEIIAKRLRAYRDKPAKALEAKTEADRRARDRFGG